ncbi:FAD-dependent oxidoreductase [Aneurinibacillus migulanus]|uniref:2-polyprenyl-6-methoxyphenol hydroxylase n=1 Tax=Aneurinibacillus migulanus TaxID=47500 RepID=A0A0D1WDI9_ANEMI|nr:FAD-dependent oxidoreductase [Aneurinibacillus migulanus]KIV56580.1 hypothetical protein TS65_12220 [Aneurinibacillus migulanus]KON95340.1 hypothetical protein AF333_07440 [Aneurinibacillus migulanus]MED0893711.1 FAD-dependent oxidoreductase [Aneurinibacillus migulanus]MED1617785.1 FAD-dependent oxidoreductase [Aneurinibacillus migulanus]MED4728410.1 FAD-dependent oxidoreductase [Aneurinibacillus migulanus]
MGGSDLKFDVIVAGAGPGGCTLAYLLARSGVRVALVERHKELDREFRGYFFQPSVMKLFDQMGVLDGVLALPHRKIDAFHFIDHGKRLFSVRFDDLPRPYHFGVNLAQPLLLQFLIDKASAFDNFTFMSGTVVTDLIKGEKGVSGVQVRRGGEWFELSTRVVVGADGRYSTVRKLAGIEQEKEEHQFDFVWFDMPTMGGKKYPLQIQIEDEGMLIHIPMGKDKVQIGWVIRKGTYNELRRQGIEQFRNRLSAVEPGLQSGLAQHLVDFKQCSILDIQVAMMKSWVQDGLLLIGDAAHIASPFSGQGNSLAIQDAVAAHPVIMEALRTSTGILSKRELHLYEKERRPAVAQIQSIQRMQANMLGIRNPLLLRLRRTAVPIVSHTPLFERMRNKLALGAKPVHVATDYFVRQ